MDTTMNLMKQNMSQASTLLKFSTFESIPVESESSKEVQPLNVLTSTGCEVEEVEETADGDNTSLIHAHMASLSLAFIPVKSAPMLSQGIPLAKQMPKVKEVRSLRKESKDLEKNATGLLSSTAMLTKSLVAPSPIRTPVTISTNRTLFPDLIRVPGKNNFSSPISVGGTRKSSIVWFRNDLRVHDHEALVAAHNDSLSVLPVFCFDPRDYGKSSSGFDRTGPYRAQFLLDCVSDLRASLRSMGSDLVVRIGHPEEVIPSLAKSVGAQAVFAHQEVSKEEMSTEEKVTRALSEEGITTHLFWGSTLFHKDDLPFSSLEAMPTSYAGFKEKIEGVAVRATLETPEKLKSIPGKGKIEVGDIPTLKDLGLKPAAGKQENVRAGPGLVGGEKEALQRLTQFVAEAKTAISGAKQNGESLMGANFSCKISPWLATGCVSPRKMYQDLKASSPTARMNLSTSSNSGSGLSWLVFELLWRDFFRFISMRYNMIGQQSSVPCAV